MSPRLLQLLPARNRLPNIGNYACCQEDYPSHEYRTQSPTLEHISVVLSCLLLHSLALRCFNVISVAHGLSKENLKMISAQRDALEAARKSREDALKATKV